MNDDDLWLDALLDDELDAAASLALQRRLAAEPALQARLDARRALRDAIRGQATRHAAPDELRAKLMAMLPPRTDAGVGAGARAGMGADADAWAGGPANPRASLERRGSRAARRRRVALPWATGLGGALLAAVCTLAVVAPGTLGWPRGEAMASLQTAEASEAVSAHTRALLVDHPIEVASSDQHTVRPWLSARLNFVPPVTDFAPQGYPLVGARRDVLSGETAAALVYRHGAHVISVFVRPVDPSATRAAEATRVVRGFNVIERTQGGLAFCFVSDANPRELAALADLVAPLAGA
jgi:anti-sigma factor RsiW